MTATQTPAAGPGTGLRILVAKLGLDGHDIGARLVARYLRDDGHEVIYSGLHGRPEGIARAAMDEAADAIGVSILSGAHVALCRELLDALRAQGADSIPVAVGGLILPAEADTLLEMGVAAVFPSTQTEESDFLEYFRSLVPRGD